MSNTEDPEITRIRTEYERRRREISKDFYSWRKPVNQFFHSQLTRLAIRVLVEHNLFPLGKRSFLEVGCGTGSRLVESLHWGALPSHVAGIDLIEDRVKSARAVLSEADIQCGDARDLPWSDASFDVVSQFTVFTSILDPTMKQTVASEMIRVLKSDGIILWYDFRYDNPFNHNVKGVGARELRSLFPGCHITLHATTLAPPVARTLVPISWIAALVLEKIPFLRTHYLAVIKKNKRNT